MQTLQKLIIFLGYPVRVIPTDSIQRSVLINSLKSDCAKWSEDDVLNALRLALKNEIKFDVKLFDNSVSASYFIDLMGKYDKYIAPAMTKYYEESAKQKRLESNSEQQIEYKRKMSVRKSYYDCKQGIEYIGGKDAILAGNFDYLWSKGILTSDYLTESLKSEIKQQAKEELKEEMIRKKSCVDSSEIKRQITEVIKSIMTEEYNETKDFKNRCKSIALEGWFIEISLDENRNIEEILNL